MPQMSNREAVIDVLRHAAQPLNDDEIARRARIQPRQTVNQVCRVLAAEGVITRTVGSDGRIENALRDGVAHRSTDGSMQVLAPAEIAPLPGDSREQRDAELFMLAALGAELGAELNPGRIAHPSGAFVQIDGVSADLTILVECWAHQGPAKVAQKYKLMNDAVKLHWIAQSLPIAPRLILCLTDPRAHSHLDGRSWQGYAIRDLGVELRVVPLPDAVRDAVEKAQIRQFR